jgi:hypothetical protein
MSEQTPVSRIRPVLVAKLFEILSKLFTVSLHDSLDCRGKDRRRALFEFRSVDQTKSRLGPQPFGDELVRAAADEFSNSKIFFLPQQYADIAWKLWGIPVRLFE